jgi:hypothetical protein
MSSLLVFLRWCSNFVGSESGQKQSAVHKLNMEAEVDLQSFFGLLVT